MTLKKLVAEFIGTFALVFAGTGAIVVNETSSGMITQVGIALTFGLIVLAMIYTLGDISGAHINPAVTIGFWVARRFPFAAVSPYFALVAQSQLFPQLHSLLSFMGQFLPVFLQFGLSAAKPTVQIAAVRIENRIFV